MKIRKAVSAIIKYKDKFLLIHKVKIMSGKNGPFEIPAEWDFPRGEIELGDSDLEKALLRELKEETGSDQYKILKKFDEKISFDFLPHVQKRIGFKGQEVIMFLVEYTGDKSDIDPQDEEIDRIQFFTKEEVVKKLHHDTAREFFKKFVN